jgi:hypothetical protein
VLSRIVVISSTDAAIDRSKPIKSPPSMPPIGKIAFAEAFLSKKDSPCAMSVPPRRGDGQAPRHSA